MAGVNQSHMTSGAAVCACGLTAKEVESAYAGSMIRATARAECSNVTAQHHYQQLPSAAAAAAAVAPKQPTRPQEISVTGINKNLNKILPYLVPQSPTSETTGFF